MSGLCVIVMAAGLGKRMRSDLPKVLHEAAGRPMLMRVLDAAASLGPERVVVVTGHRSDLVRERVRRERRDVAFAEQREQLGTGHAVLTAMPEVPAAAPEVMVLSGDTPLLTPALLAALLGRHRASGADATVLSMTPPEPAAYGRVVRTPDRAWLSRIVEFKDASEAERAVREVNAGLYVFRRAALAAALARLRNDNRQGEYYLTDTIGLIAAGGGRIAVEPGDYELCLGVNSPDELAAATEAIRRRERPIPDCP